MFGIKTAMKLHLHNTFNPLHKLVDEMQIRLLMNHFRADEYGHQANIDTADMGYGWLHYGFIRHMKPQRILCVGSGYGFIPGVFAQACHDNGFGHVDFVDAGYGSSHRSNWTWVGYWKTLEGRMSFKEFGLGNWISLYMLTTKQFERKYPTLVYDYIYIDGGHLYKEVVFDYKVFWPKLRQGGFMSFHDVSIKERQAEGEYGVWKLWKDISYQHSIIFEHPATGLGIIQKK